MKNYPKTLHMIGNAHIDPVWLWRWHEGYHEVLATVRSALDRMEEDPDFTFTCSSAAFYAWVEEADPAMFAEIQRRVAEGRWEIVGGWWIQPDCNIPSGEAFARQALYGQHFFQSRFGKIARVGYNVDSFGHHAMLPQLLKQAGLDYYVFMRPSPHEKGLPNRVFWWEADDGSRVLAFRLPFEYCTWGRELDRHVQRCAAELNAPYTEMMCFYGVGNHGGGPTKENLESIHRMAADPAGPNLVFSSTERYFRQVEASGLPIPVVHDELQHHGSGCYAAHSAVKRWNRTAENRLLMAEKLAVVAQRATGRLYPDNLDRAWKNVLFNQFHDILAGTSVASAYEDARDMHGEAMAIAERALNSAVQSLAWNVQIPQVEGARQIVVFNPHAWKSHANVEVEFGGRAEAWVLRDDTGRELPVQPIRPESATLGRSRFTFTAELPSLGYRVFSLMPGQPQLFRGVTASDTVLDNGRLRLEIDPQTGTLCSLRDLVHNVEVLAGRAARPAVIEDHTDTWGHNVFNFGEGEDLFVVESVRLLTDGPVKSTIRVTSCFGASRLIQDFTMYPDQEHIDVHVTVDWHGQHQMLKLRFPLNLMFMRVVHEIPYGHLERFANGEEMPFQRWVDVSGVSKDTGERYGLSVLNDGKYSVDVMVRDVGLTVLRSPIYAHHMPVEPDPDVEYRYVDQGVQEFNYTLLPHVGSWEEAGTVRRAEELNQRPFVLVATSHPQGSLPLSDSYLHVDAENVNVTVLKQAEDGKDVILRAYETAHRATLATFHLPHWGRTFTAEFGACEIKTFRVPADPAAPVAVTNFLEWTEEKLEPALPLITAQGGVQMQGTNGNQRRVLPEHLVVSGDHIDRLVQRYPDLETCASDIRAAYELLAGCYGQDGKVLACGNGGSAADCEHLVAELMKAYLFPRELPDATRERLVASFPEEGPALAAGLQGALPAISLVSQTGLNTAYANDVAPEMVFAQQVFGYGRPGDVVVGISTSGNSSNILRAFQVARAQGLRTLGFSGAGGGALAGLSDVLIAVPQCETATVQERHLAIYHALCAMLEETFFSGAKDESKEYAYPAS